MTATTRAAADRETSTPGPTIRRYRVRRLRAPAWLDGPMVSLHLVLGSAGLLLVIGLVMVFSASSVEAALKSQPVWEPGVRQILFALVGLALMAAVLRLRVATIRRWAPRLLLGIAGLLLLVLVPGLGSKLNGSRAWFSLGPISFQPSEAAKLIFALWGAHILALRERYLTTRTLLVPALPVFGVLSLLCIVEPDFGAVTTLALVFGGLLWAGGLGWRVIGILVACAATLVVLAVQLAPYRLARYTSFLDPFADPLGDGLQAVRGIYALATGGFTGVGLGNSRMKWNLLPHAESDFIFAIIGEELGFLGCLVVVTLYGVLAWAGFRIARRSADRFVQLASVAITTWLIGQALINMGYVVGLLPVTGVTLPLISAGGTSLVLTLVIVGLLARFAVTEPAAVESLRRRERSRLARWLLPVPPHAVDPVRLRRRTAPADGDRPARRPAVAGRRTVVRVPGRREADREGPAPRAGGVRVRPPLDERARAARRPVAGPGAGGGPGPAARGGQGPAAATRRPGRPR